MRPTVFRCGGYRFRFFSRVYSADGEAKFWLEPEIALAHSIGLADRALREVQRVIEEREDEIREAWARHFGG